MTGCGLVIDHVDDARLPVHGGERGRHGIVDVQEAADLRTGLEGARAGLIGDGPVVGAPGMPGP